MSTPNEDALKCAGDLEKIVSVFGTPSSRNAERDSAAHIRRLVAENEALTNGRHALQAALIRKQGRELGEQDALLRQALELLEDNREDVARVETTYMHKHYDPVVHAIRQHLGQKGETG